MSSQNTRLRFVFADMHSCYTETELLGRRVRPRQRTVEITLTDEQQAALQARRVGRSCGRDVFEQIIDYFIEAPDNEGER